MEPRDELLQDRSKDMKKLNLEKENLQYNAQDLDQEQNVEVRPIQRNSQDVHIHINNDRIDFSGKITGTTCMESTAEFLKNVEIELFFGTEGKNPVYRTNSDCNGNYSLEDLPPGYYTIYAKYGDIFWFKSHYIKVLPCQIVNVHLLLKTYK